MSESMHDLNSLAALVEGRLDASERQRVMRHLANCADCRRTVAELGREQTTSAGKSLSLGRSPIWMALAASVLIGTFTWFQLAERSGTTGSTDPQSDSADDSAEDLLRTRSAARKVDDRTFRMRAGEWVDTSFNPALELPTVTVRGSAERSELLERIPELAPYAALGSRVVVNWKGTVYRFEP